MTTRLIESIREIRVVRQFLVKWKNRPETENSWINENELINMHNLAVTAATSGDSLKLNDQRSSVSIQSPTVSDANREFSVDTSSSGPTRASRGKSRAKGPARRAAPATSPRKRRSLSPESPSQEEAGERGVRSKSVFAQRGVKKLKKTPEVKNTGRKARGKSVFVAAEPNSPEESSGNKAQRPAATSTPLSDDNDEPMDGNSPPQGKAQDGESDEEEEEEEQGDSQPSAASLVMSGVEMPSFSSVAASQPVAAAFSTPSFKNFRRSVLMESSRSPSKTVEGSPSQSQSLNDSANSSIVSNEVPEPVMGPRISKSGTNSQSQDEGEKEAAGPSVDGGSTLAERPVRKAGRPPSQIPKKKRTGRKSSLDSGTASTSKGKKEVLPQYEVEKVLGAKYDGRVTWYLVQWKGYNSPDDNTWESQYNLKGAMDRVDEFVAAYGVAGYKQAVFMSPEGEAAEKLRTNLDTP